MPVAIAGVAVAAVGAIFSGIQGDRAQREARREARRQRALAQEQLNFAKEQWDYYQDTYGDLTKLMVADAMEAEIGDIQGQSDRAAADISNRFGAQREATDRQMFAYGLDPSRVDMPRRIEARTCKSHWLALRRKTKRDRLKSSALI